MSPWIEVLGVVLGPAGAAWIAVKVALNGARQDIRDIKSSVGELTSAQNATGRDVARLDERVKHLEEAA